MDRAATVVAPPRGPAGCKLRVAPLTHAVGFLFITYYYEYCSTAEHYAQMIGQRIVFELTVRR